MIFDFKNGFDDDRSLPCSPRPLVAISANIIDDNSALHSAYSQAIIDAGATPIVIPFNCDASALKALIRGVDALLLSGGADIDARYFGEENRPELTEVNLLRDHYEFSLLRLALSHSLPILGICRGCQLLNIALGGSIYQDLPTMYDQKPLLKHSILTNRELPAHDAKIVSGTLLHKVLGCERVGVNSRHHQAIRRVAPSLRVSALSDDGVVEAVESYPTHKIMGVQWHPENMATKGDSPEMKRLFSHFVAEADLYRRAKQIHLLNPIIDSHCDTPMLYEQGGFDFALRNSLAKVDLPKMVEGYLDSTITVAYIPQSSPKQRATEMAISTLRRFKSDIEKVDGVIVATSPLQVARAKSQSLKSVMLGVENGLAIGSEISNIDLFRELGVSYITLCHNGSNQICDSAVGEAPHNGVSPFGRAAIERMNQLGVTVDISHSSHKSTLDAVEISCKPIIASHSSCRALCNHPRNLSDSCIKAIAAKGGVVQICAYGWFLREDGDKATIDDLVAHIEHVVSLTGYNHVGVGSDFDGGGSIVGFDGANDFINVTIELLRRGHSEECIAKIMGGNILRLLTHNSNS